MLCLSKIKKDSSVKNTFSRNKGMVINMKFLFVEYPKCTTCKKAKAFLDAKGIDYTDRHIKEDNPSVEELESWIEKSGLDINRFFNTSGILYREMGLKDKLADMSEDEKLTILSSDGMLVKRPILVGDDFVLVGFKESQWTEKLEVKR